MMNKYIIFAAILMLLIFSTYLISSPNITSLFEKFEDQRDVMRRIDNNKELIAVVTGAHSSKGWIDVTSTALHNLLIPSIERTVSEQEKQSYQVEMVICFDTNDEFFENTKNIEDYQSSTSIPLNFISIPKSKERPLRIPTNECTKAAYEYGAKYIVRVNDDTEFVTPEWITKGALALSSYTPPNVGVVGPTCHEGNYKILTHDMVHRTHLEIFPNYYPDIFDNWFVDDWITLVYGESNTKKVEDWTVIHHMDYHGTRYTPRGADRNYLEREVTKGKERIENYLKKRGEFYDVLGTDRVSAVWGPMASKHHNDTMKNHNDTMKVVY